MLNLPRRLFIALLLVAALGGCGYPKHIDPPLLTYPTQTLTILSAEAHARDVGGLMLPITGTSHSMGSLMGPGDYLVINTKAPFSERREGEVISYVPSGADWVDAEAPKDAWVAHRIVGKDGAGLLLSGDGNARSEARSRVTAATYRGLIVGIYRVKA